MLLYSDIADFILKRKRGYSNYVFTGYRLLNVQKTVQAGNPEGPLPELYVTHS